MILNPRPHTLPELLEVRARTSSHKVSQIAFLNVEGKVQETFSYAQLFCDSSSYARRILAAGLTRSDVVLASFPDHERHIRLFWACCIAGIPICPLPALHPDPSRQTLLFKHLEKLFGNPTLVAPPEILQSVRHLVPELTVLDVDDLREESGDSFIFPSRRPSPHDPVCFMLTSGSTGNSKAVSLSHLNLLSGVRGKIQHHGTTATSRFLNWIAFDHVACISEMMLLKSTLGSQYHVLPEIIIRSPRSLLEWASALRVTYTFSPNFLLAQILRDVSTQPFTKPLDLSNLTALISGGEAVPLVTAVAFADLLEKFGASRDALRAGFGMSETGAGCMYDIRPIPKLVAPESPKYLSLGKSCVSLEARVVDPITLSACSTGAAGHLQVRGPQVFREYFGNPLATKESFTDGWFTTGDVAEMDQDGNCSLVGREKDCLNINGVKYLPQDIEHYVEDAGIDGVKHSYVFVCPMRLENADTETYSVFYQHQLAVEHDLDRDQIRSVNITSIAVKKACTIFCSLSPHTVLPLPRTSFVKTALGKVSRSQLAKFYIQGNFKDIQSTFTLHDHFAEQHPTDRLLSPLDKTVADIMASTFSIDPSVMRRSQNIFDLGASSVHLIRLKQSIQGRLFLTDLPTVEMLKRPQIGELCDYLATLTSPRCEAVFPPVSSYQPLVCLNHNGSKPPLFLVHPGVGEILVFLRLASVLNDDRPIYGIRARGFDHSEAPFETFEEMLVEYTSSIEKAYPNGPYYIAGYSFGGVVAFEIGKKLEAKGRKVDFVGILNLPPHIQFRMKELTWTEVLLNLGMFFSLFQPSELCRLRLELAKAFLEVSSTMPSNPQELIHWLFDHSDPDRLAELDLETTSFLRWVHVAFKISRTGRNFEPKGAVTGALTTVFCAIPLPSMGTREVFKEQRLSAWKEFSGKGFEMIDVDGEHYTMLSDQHVLSFAGHMRNALRRAASRRKTLDAP